MIGKCVINPSSYTTATYYGSGYSTYGSSLCSGTWTSLSDGTSGTSGTTGGSTGSTSVSVSQNTGTADFGTSTNYVAPPATTTTTSTPTCDDNAVVGAWKKNTYSTMDTYTFSAWSCDVTWKSSSNSCEIKLTHAIKHYTASSDTMLLTCVGMISNPNNFSFCDCVPGTSEVSYVVSGSTLTLNGNYYTKQ